MVVKVYISGISGNKEVKKRQQRVLMILDSKHIKYEIIDITEPGREADKDFMQSNSKSNGATVSDPNPRSALPPQIFNDEEYCGDYDQFDLANEVDTLEQFVKVEAPPEEPPQVNDEQEKAVNGVDDETKTETTEAESEVAPESSETKDETKEGSPVKEDTTIKDAASKEGTPAKDDSGEAKEDTKEASEKDSTDRAKSVDKEATPEKAQSPEPEKVSKESSPEKEVNEQQKDSASKESSPEKEINEQEKENASKESSPEKEVNENGTTSSRGQSEEKDAEEVVERKKDNPSEALIQSEQAAAE